MLRKTDQGLQLWKGKRVPWTPKLELSLKIAQLEIKWMKHDQQYLLKILSSDKLPYGLVFCKIK